MTAAFFIFLSWDFCWARVIAPGTSAVRSSVEAPSSSSLSKIKSSFVDSEDTEAGDATSLSSSSGNKYLDLCEAEGYVLESFEGMDRACSGLAEGIPEEGPASEVFESNSTEGECAIPAVDVCAVPDAIGIEGTGVPVVVVAADAIEESAEPSLTIPAVAELPSSGSTV